MNLLRLLRHRRRVRGVAPRRAHESPAVFRDMPGADGDPTLTIVPAAEMEDLIPNSRTLARTFSHADNYYSGAEQSIQGHVWTTLGRTTDFVERTWLTTWGRGFWSPPPAET